MDLTADLPPEGPSAVGPEIPGYVIEDHLGTGAFGAVWSAVQKSTGQRVAVKVLARFNPRMRDEVKRLSLVTEHPHIATLLDANLEHDPPYLITTLLGAPLQPAHQDGANGVARVATWLEQITEAMQYIHGRGLLHCDLKPSNILLDPDGRIRVVDFGQAQGLSDSGRNLETWWFMPPQQADSEAGLPEVSWDVYALGATAYFLLTGRLPRANAAG